MWICNSLIRGTGRHFSAKHRPIRARAVLCIDHLQGKWGDLFVVAGPWHLGIDSAAQWVQSGTLKITINQWMHLSPNFWCQWNSRFASARHLVLSQHLCLPTSDSKRKNIGKMYTNRINHQIIGHVDSHKSRRGFFTLSLHGLIQVQVQLPASQLQPLIATLTINVNMLIPSPIQPLSTMAPHFLWFHPLPALLHGGDHLAELRSPQNQASAFGAVERHHILLHCKLGQHRKWQGKCWQGALLSAAGAPLGLLEFIYNGYSTPKLKEPKSSMRPAPIWTVVAWW